LEAVRLDSPVSWPAVAVAIGNFDGVHHGHQALLRATVEEARRRDGVSVVLTFDPHPQAVVGQRPVPRRLTTDGQRARILSGLGVDRLALLPFTPERARETPAEFGRAVLAGMLDARAVVVGENFRFGRDRAGDVEVLRGMGPALGFEVRALPPVLHDGRPVSSTRIRAALEAGDVEEARALLGRPFALEGVVESGDGRGRTIGVPTANLRPETEALPAVGVYAGRVRLPDGGRATAVVNVGRRPTFGGTGATTVEAHILDFEGDLYGRRLEVELELRLREERAFPDAAALVAQIRDDVATARARLGAGTAARPSGGGL
jgi:riboflavin kinase/FMN adenylyltransferase